jgi:2-polyprenyl-3-methyl-5-hydroxy-6-metoxy-1,4-benzoquinol methylase
MSFAEKSLDEIRAEMNKQYAEGTAYADMVPWDVERMKQIHGNVLELAARPFGTYATVAPGKNVHARMPERPFGLTLDVGCGQGGIASYWPRKDFLVGVEISEVAVEKAKKEHPTVDYHASAIEDFEYDKKLDTIVAVESIEHWKSVPKGLDNIRKLIDDNGVFVLTTPNRDSLHARIGRKLGLPVPFCSHDHVYEFGFDELIALLHSHGFKVTRSLGACLMPYWALEREFGNKIRRMTDEDATIVKLLGEAGTNVPHIAFVQCHACVPIDVPE